MKAHDKVHVLQEKAVELGRRCSPTPAGYPMEVVDLIIFHKLHLAMPMSAALRSFRRLKGAFVDWNEVRVSSVREIQEVLSGAEDALHVAVFIKDFLEFIHRQHQTISLEFLVEQNLGEIRRYLRQVRGLDNSTVSLVLRLRKEYPVLPLDRAMEAVLARIGILRHADNRNKKERILHEMVEPTKALSVHHFLLNHSREFCPPDETAVDCPHCCMRRICTFRPTTAFRATTELRMRTRGAAKNSRSVPDVSPRSSASRSRDGNGTSAREQSDSKGRGGSREGGLSGRSSNGGGASGQGRASPRPRTNARHAETRHADTGRRNGARDGAHPGGRGLPPG